MVYLITQLRWISSFNARLACRAILFIVTVFLAVVFYLIWGLVKLVARLFKQASVGLKSNMSLLPTNIIFAICALLVKLAMIITIVFYYGQMNVVPSDEPSDQYTP